MHVCLSCGATRSPADPCPDHPDEPLVDAADPAVRDQLRIMDDQARDRADTRSVYLGASLGFGLGLLVCALAWPILSITDEGPMLAVLVTTGLGVLLARRRARQRFRPRFAAHTGEATWAELELDADAQGAATPGLAHYVGLEDEDFARFRRR